MHLKPGTSWADTFQRCVSAEPEAFEPDRILNLVGGLDRASAGTVEVEGADLGLLGDDALTRYRAERIGFVEGSNWDERLAGTNAPGLALATGRDAIITRDEHFPVPRQQVRIGEPLPFTEREFRESRIDIVMGGIETE